MLALQREQSAVAVFQVGWGGKVRRRCPPKTPEDRCDVNRDADPAPGRESAGVALPPVGARRAVVVKVGVNVNEHAANLS